MPTTDVRPATPDAIRHAADLIRRGRLVAFPTETVYGLGANAFDPAAVAAVFAAKGRPATNPLIVHVTSQAWVGNLVGGWPTNAMRLAGNFWPGPLTVVVEKAPAVPDIVTAGGPTVAIRCPAHPIAQALLREVQIPLAAPSANRSGELSPTTAEHVRRSLDGRIDLILDGGPCPGGLESTVLDVTRPTVRLLRPGLITVAQVETLVGAVEVALVIESTEAPIPSPGMLTRHYSPRTKMECVESIEEADTLAAVYETAGLRVGRWVLTGSPEQTSSRLYADLHDLDARGYDRIIATLPPETDAWRAVRDRLLRASAE